jgi:hypothetical protein
MYGSPTRAMAHAIENSQVIHRNRDFKNVNLYSLFSFACRIRTKKVATAKWKRTMHINSSVISFHSLSKAHIVRMVGLVFLPQTKFTSIFTSIETLMKRTARLFKKSIDTEVSQS